MGGAGRNGRSAPLICPKRSATSESSCEKTRPLKDSDSYVIHITMGATKVSGTDFLAIVSDRAENLGIGLEAQVMKVDNEIL